MTLLDGREYEVQYMRDLNERTYAAWSRYCYLEMAIAVAERLRGEGRIARVVAVSSMSNGGNHA